MKLKKNQMQPAIDDYMGIQAFNEDRGFAHVNKAVVYRYQGQLDLAEQAYKTAIRVEPHDINGYIYLADLYRNSTEVK